jgi:hypothetical protein
MFFRKVIYYINKDSNKDSHFLSSGTHVYKLTLPQHECDIYRNEEGSTLVVVQKELVWCFQESYNQTRTNVPPSKISYTFPAPDSPSLETKSNFEKLKPRHYFKEDQTGWKLHTKWAPKMNAEKGGKIKLVSENGTRGHRKWGNGSKGAMATQHS